jgi:hypothetical protein
MPGSVSRLSVGETGCSGTGVDCGADADSGVEGGAVLPHASAAKINVVKKIVDIFFICPFPKLILP